MRNAKGFLMNHNVFTGVNSVGNLPKSHRLVNEMSCAYFNPLGDPIYN
jgi:hypothetical protein